MSNETYSDDVAQTNLSAPERSPYDIYEGVPPVEVVDGSGRTLTHTIKITSAPEFDHDQGGSLVATYPGMQIVTAEDGRETKLYYQRISTRVRDKGRMAGTSQAMDILVGCDSPEKPLPGAPDEEWEQALQALNGAQFETSLGWEAYDKDAGETLAYLPARRDQPEKVFPKDAEGRYIPYIDSPSGKRILARARLGFIRTRR